MLERKVVVRLIEGLHARPATQFVKLARSFACDLQIRRKGKSANAKSAVKLMLLGVKEDDEVVLRAEGADEAAAMDALCGFVSEREPQPETLPAEAPQAPVLQAPLSEGRNAGMPAPRPAETAAARQGAIAAKGAPASSGTAVGPAFAFLPERIDAPRRRLVAAEIEGEIGRLRASLAHIADELARRAANAAPKSQEAEILMALAEIGRDEELACAIEAEIRDGLDAVSAALEGGRKLAGEFQAMEDPYQQERAQDIAAYARQVALALIGKREVSLAEAPPDTIILADEISAFDLSTASVSQFGGLVALRGGPMSHVAIIARSYSVPAVLGVDLDIEQLRAAKTVALDGASGEVALDPDPSTTATFRARIEEGQARKEMLRAFAQVEPRTRDGRLIEIAANLGTLKEIDGALAAGAMGVGLFRTELLFMEHKRPPTEDEQAEVYATLAAAFAPRPVIVRTLDIGGDKSTPGIVVPKEDNPFLGWRGVRLCLDRLDIFKPQIRALLRAATHGNLKVMIPMVADVEEIRAVKRVVAECRAELAAEGVAHGVFDLGVMAETPASALAASALAAESAFFSIGTNDLTQYVMAADRLNAKLAHLGRVDHPAVLKAVAMICEAARAAGIWVGVCGEAAARTDMIPKFVALGVTELSMSAAAIPAAKKCVTEI